MADTQETAPARPPTRQDASIEDTVETLKGYARQELVGPLRGAGNWIAFGAAGAFALGLGLLYVILGTLRLLQTEWERSSSGSLSWLAYLIVFILTVLLLALTISRIKKSTLGNEPTAGD